MSEKHQPDSHAPDELADIETLRLQAVADVSNGNERISPVPPVATSGEDNDATIKRAVIKHNTQDVPSSIGPLSAKPAGSELKESGTQHEVPSVEQLEFPPTNDPFQVEISLFDTLNLPTAPAEVEVSLVDTLTVPTTPTTPATLPFTGKLPDTPSKVDVTSPIQEHTPYHKSNERYEASQHTHHSRKDMVHRSLILACKYPLLLWGFSPSLFVLVLLVPLLGSGLLEYSQLHQTRNSMYRVDLLTGTIQWQHMITTPTQTAIVDNQGSFLITSAGGQQHRLEAFDRNGILQWHTFASAETFSLPLASSPAGTVLMALSNVSSTSAQASSKSSTTYLSPLSFYLLRRATGQTIWHKTLVEVRQQQQAEILGADNQFIFVALTEIASSLPTTTLGTKLLALDQATGNIAWQVFAPIPHNLHLYDGGKLLVQQHHVIWQVMGSVYAIATPSGTIQWQKSITEDRPEILPQEEAQMVEVAGLLVVERSDVYHALDIASGYERWLLVNPAGDALSSNNMALAAVGHTLLIYGLGGIQAVDITDQHILWSQKQLNSIQNLNASDDGKLIYTTVTNSIEDSTPAQALVAIDSGNGAARWTFQPTAQATFLPLGSSGILYRHLILLTAVCPSYPQQTCAHVIIYALNATTGKIIWKYEGNSIDDVHISADASTIEFQSNSSPWQDLLGHFRS